MMKNVMSKAWEVAREGAEKFGGKAVEYFVEALRMAWAEIKKGVNNLKETTGLKAMYFPEVGSCLKIVTDNGHFAGTIEEYNYRKISPVMELKNLDIVSNVVKKIFDKKEGYGNPTQGGTMLKLVSDEELAELISENERIEKEKLTAVKNTKIEYAEPSRHLCPKCGSYCWGDCEAN